MSTMEAHSAQIAEMRERAEAVLAKAADSRIIEKRGRSSHSYRPVRVTIGEAEQLARDVVALTHSPGVLRGERHG